VLADRASQQSRRLAARQSLDQLQLFEGVVKAGATLTAARAERLLGWAWEKAARPPRGPVHLDLPADQAERRARLRRPLPPVSGPAAPSPHAVRSVARQLVRRGRAVAVVGLGSRSASAVRPLLDLVEHLGTPTFTTPKAKGAIPEDHPLAAGVFSGGRLEEELLAEADSVLAIGLDSVELLPRPWRPGTPVIVIGGPHNDPRPYRAATEVGGDVALALEALRAESPPGGEWNLAGWAGRGGRFKARTRARVAEASAAEGPGVPPHRVVEIAREVFPRDTILAAESGVPALVASVFWDSYDRNGYLCSSGLGVSGYALPAGMAAKLTLPERPVLALTTGPSLLLSLAELSVAARLGLPLAVVAMLHDEPGAVGWRADLAKVSDGLGIAGIEVGDAAALRAALADAAATTQPAVIGVHLPPTAPGALEALAGRAAG